MGYIKPAFGLVFLCQHVEVCKNAIGYFTIALKRSG
jgi:hypothetical protein